MLAWLINMGFAASASGSPTPTPTPIIRRGGGRSRRYVAHTEPPRRLNKEIDDLLEQVAAEVVYGRILESAPDSTIEQAVKVVRPFTNEKRDVPPPASIDWDAIERDTTRVRRLLTLWRQAQVRKARRAEDDDFLLLH